MPLNEPITKGLLSLLGLLGSRPSTETKEYMKGYLPFVAEQS